MELKTARVECFNIDKNKSYLNIDIELQEQFKLFYLKEKFQVDKLIDVSCVQQLEFQRNYNEKKRSYYAIQQQDDKMIIFGERILPIKGMFNFRDIGGYPTITGKRVKWGRIYRGDHLFNLHEDSYEYIENLEITHIIDLRSADEVKEFPNKKVGEHVKTLNVDPNAPIAELFGELMDGVANENKLKDLNTIREEMIYQQLRFVNDEESKRVFALAIKEIINNADGNFYIHCRGGKDRTGYLIMLILGALGVSTKYLVDDYLLTNVARKQKNIDYWNKFYDKAKNVRKANFFYNLYEIEDDYILASINEINLKYNGFENYLFKELNITPTELNHLRERLLEV